MTEIVTCERHGEASVWVVCRHVGTGSADTIIFSENQDALCLQCAHNIKNITKLNVVGMCEVCLKDFPAKLMIDTQALANLKNRLKGIEHLKGKRSFTAESERTT